MQKEQKTQAQRLEALYKVSTQLGSTLDLSELLNVVIDAVIQLTEAERGFVVLVDEWGRLKTMAARNVDQETIGGTEIPISRTIVQRVVATGEPVLTSNAQEDARFADRRSIIGYQFRSIMSAPLRARDRVTGAVFVDNHMLSGVFNDDDLDLLVTFANQAAMAIDNARLFQQTDQALNRRVEELSLFQQIDRELHTAEDLSRTISLVLEWAINLTNANATAVGLLETIEDEEGEPKEVMKVKTLTESGNVRTVSPEMGLLELTHPTLAQMFTNHDIVQRQNIAADQSFTKQQVATQLTIPVLLDGKILGFLAIESTTVSLFFEEDIEFLRRLSDRAAVAIGNSRLHEQWRNAVEDRTRFISIMTHELRLPLTSIRGYSDLMAKQLVGPLNDQQQNFMETIQRNIMRMSRLISDLSDLNRLESGRMNAEPSNFSIGTAMQKALESLQPDIDKKQQTIKSGDLTTAAQVHLDEHKVVQILTNILENANKYTPENGTINIALNPESSDNQNMVSVTIKDNGIGIRDDERKKVFDQFFRSEEQAVRDNTGWGLGLSVAQMLQELLGGQIQLDSVHGEGTEVTLLFPKKG